MNGESFLTFLRARRSVRAFRDEPVPRRVLERLIEAATSAPSATNRQPWRFSVVTAPSLRRELAAAIRARKEEMLAIVRRSHHADEVGHYWDFFHEPIEAAAAVVIPQYRIFPDLIAELVASGGGNPDDFVTGKEMNAELCATSAAVMNLLLQAHAEGLGACWMTGPLIARDAIAAALRIPRAWGVLGAVVLGYPDEQVVAKGRKPLAQVVDWFDGAE